jgi:hypothetical protein
MPLQNTLDTGNFKWCHINSEKSKSPPGEIEEKYSIIVEKGSNDIQSFKEDSKDAIGIMSFLMLHKL